MMAETLDKTPPEERIDKITNKPLREKLTLLSVRVNHNVGPFFQIFLAAETDSVDEIVEQISETISVSKENVLQIDFPPESMDINNELLQLTEKMRDISGDRVVIVVKGIVRRGKFVKSLNRETSESTLATFALDRVMHDYSQEIFDSTSGEQLRAKYVNMGKKAIIITHIDHSEGEEIYKAMVRSALQTRFQTGVLEI